MILSSLITIPVLGTILMSSIGSYMKKSELYTKTIALTTSIINLILSLVMFILFNNSTNQFDYNNNAYSIII
jgi:NADH:ubiquinone oxidoreductase subunit 4 (subunit M)